MLDVLRDVIQIASYNVLHLFKSKAHANPKKMEMKDCLPGVFLIVNLIFSVY